MPTGVLPSPETVSALLIVATVLHALALFSTSFRLWFRHHTRRLWWDDLWAALTLPCDAVCMVVMWMISAPLDYPYRNIEALPTLAEPRSVHVISVWLVLIFYTSTIWLARISIVSSVVRIVPPARSVSMTALGSGGLFFCMWVYMLACKMAVCSMDKSWYDAPVIQCPLPDWVTLSEVCTDVLSDVVLVLVSLRFLWRVKLPSDQRIMVLSIFSTSILVSVVSVVHTAYGIPEVTFIGRLTAAFEGAISVIVCNLLVIVTFVYRVIRNGRDLAAGLSDKHATPLSDGLTTVDLDFVGPSWLSGETRLTGTGLTQTTVSSMGVSQADDSDKTLGSAIVFAGGPGHHDGSALPTSIPMKQP